MPKSFVHKCRDDGGHAFQGSREKTGVIYTQGGEFDRNILCEPHERSLSDCDDYAFDFVDNFESRKSTGVQTKDGIFWLPNPKPDLLLKFAVSLIWRHSISPRFSVHATDLGPWERRVREYLFHPRSLKVRLSLACRSYLIGDQVSNGLIFSPYQEPYFGKRGWQFETLGIVWSLAFGTRKISTLPKPFVANGQNPVPVFNWGKQPLHERYGFLDIARNMNLHHKHDA